MSRKKITKNIKQAKGSKTPNEAIKWWGRFQLEVGQMGLWQVGSTNFSINHLAQEWRIAYSVGRDHLSNDLSVQIPLISDESQVSEKLRRYMFSQTSNTLILTPVLANRSLVVRPETPCSVREGQRITLYVTTPLWIRVQIEESSTPLHEIPSLCLSDTWFGDNTLIGELCYSGPLAGRLSLEMAQRRPYRVLSPLQVYNNSPKPLLIERVKLPLEYLDVYAAKDNFLWTQAITLIQEKDSTKLSLDRDHPQEMGEAEKISEARQQASKNLIVRAFERFNRQSSYTPA